MKFFLLSIFSQSLLIVARLFILGGMFFSKAAWVFYRAAHSLKRQQP